MDCTGLSNRIQASLKPARYIHSLGVAFTAVMLAERFGLDVTKAYVCGIYHDAYRYSADENTLRLLEENGFILSPEEKRDNVLLHGPLAALHFDEDAGETVGDDMKRAVRHHTLGSREMGELGGIIYVSDYIEPGRRHLADEDRIMILSKRTLEEMVAAVIDRERPYLEGNGKKIASVTEELYGFIRDGGKL